MNNNELEAKVDYIYSHSFNHTLHAYIDMTGDLVSGALLAQIMYWFSETDGKFDKVRIFKDGNYWIAKKREDWWEEIRITPKQYDTAIRKLIKAGLVETKLYKFDSIPTVHIRPIFDNINPLIKKHKDGIKRELLKTENKEDNPILPKGQNGNCQNGKMEFDQTVKSLTENTDIDYNTENTNNINNNDLSINNIKNVKVDTFSKEKERVDTFPEKKPLPKQPRRKSRTELMGLQQDMIDRFGKICEEYDITENAGRNIKCAFSYYMQLYNEYTDKVHPILTDSTLESIFLILADISDTEYGHFDSVADMELNENGVSYLEEMVLLHFKAEHHGDTDYHITHFANREYLEKLANRIVEY